MAITKVSKNMSIIASLSDLPNATDGLSPAQLKAKFDEGGESLKAYINDTLIPNLESIVDGNSGADNIGVTPIGTSPSTVQGILEWLKTQIDNSALGQIPEGSITDAKLSNAEGNIKQTISVHLDDYEQQLGTATLQTSDQTLKGAINEVFQAGNSRKQELVDLLLSIDDSLPISYESTWEQILSASENISTDASGTATSSSSLVAFTDRAGANQNLYALSVSGLNFKPSAVILRRNGVPQSGASVDSRTPFDGGFTTIPCYNNVDLIYIRLTGNAFLNEGSFQLPVRVASNQFHWIAFK